jgi:hypothetical protein
MVEAIFNVEEANIICANLPEYPIGQVSMGSGQEWIV